MEFARSCGLVRGEWIVIDGSKFRAVTNEDSFSTATLCAATGMACSRPPPSSNPQSMHPPYRQPSTSYSITQSRRWASC